MTQKYLKSILNYNPQTGIFKWKIKTCKKVTPGKIAGSNQSAGYKFITIKRQNYLAHRLAWLYVYGYFPKELDHINRVRTDNKIKNLRSVNRTQNRFNSGIRSDNIIGVTGVYKYPRRHRKKRFWASITILGKRKSLGYFYTLKEASLAYKKANKEIMKRFGN